MIEEAICHLFLSFVLSFSREISFRIYLFSIPSFSLCRLFFLNQGLKHMFQFSTSTTTTMLLPRVPSDKPTYRIEIIRPSDCGASRVSVWYLPSSPNHAHAVEESSSTESTTTSDTHAKDRPNVHATSYAFVDRN